MKIDQLTIGEAKELAALFSQQPAQAAPPLLADWVGKYVLVRSRNEGINAGVVEKLDETGVILRDARRLWYHRPANKATSWYEGVSEHGLSDDSKVSCAVYRKAILEDYSLTECTPAARASIESAPSYAQS